MQLAPEAHAVLRAKGTTIYAVRGFSRPAPFRR